MSEFQYYEFQAVDRPLTDREIAELRALSTRAHITSTGFVNTYQYGDFKGRPDALMEKYFDAFIYFANWGTRICKLRLPRRLVDIETSSLYCKGSGAMIKAAQETVVFSFLHDREPDDAWDESGEGIMASLIPVRDSLLDGDLRALYLGWLLCVQQEQVKDGALEPPVPPGLGNLTGSLRAFADFLRIDQDLVDAAAEASSPHEPSDLQMDDLKRWIQALPADAKDDLLFRLVGQGALHLKAEVLGRFRETVRTGPSKKDVGDQTAPRRTVAEILAAADLRQEARKREAAERAAKERERLEAERAAAREKHLKTLAVGETQAWARVDSLIAQKPAKYGEAVDLLKDLGEVCRRAGRAAEFSRRIRGLREDHARKLTFIRRLDQAELDR